MRLFSCRENPERVLHMTVEYIRPSFKVWLDSHDPFTSRRERILEVVRNLDDHEVAILFKYIEAAYEAGFEDGWDEKEYHDALPSFRHRE
jgi:hypothetical protein